MPDMQLYRELGLWYVLVFTGAGNVTNSSLPGVKICFDKRQLFTVISCYFFNQLWTIKLAHIYFKAKEIFSRSGYDLRDIALDPVRFFGDAFGDFLLLFRVWIQIFWQCRRVQFLKFSVYLIDHIVASVWNSRLNQTLPWCSRQQCTWPLCILPRP